MTKLRERMMTDLELGGYAEETRRKYIRSIREFSAFHHKRPDTMTHEDVRRWVEHLNELGLSASTLRGHYAALRFVFAKTLGRSELVSFLCYPRSQDRLPEVLSPEEVLRVLKGIELLKYRVFCALLYGTGLRISEARRLETTDIDAARGVIHVRLGKGAKDRFVGLSESLLALLRRYWSHERPPAPLLFASRTGEYLNPKIVREALADAAKHAGINKRVTPHTLRHCFATHLIEHGTELRVIQALLGHKSIRSTTRYTRVSAGLIAKTQSPLDLLTHDKS